MFGSSWLVRVPSGYNHREVRRIRISSPAICIDRIALALLPLSTKTVPDRIINGPRGVHRSSFFAIIDDPFGINLRGEKRVRGAKLVWKAASDFTDAHLPKTSTSSID